MSHAVDSDADVVASDADVVASDAAAFNASHRESLLFLYSQLRPTHACCSSLLYAFGAFKRGL